MQTHRAYAMAGEGFPFWMELTAADRLMTSLPLFHINAPAYSVMGSLACGAGLVLLPRFSGQRLHRLGPAARRDRVQRDRGDARDPDAPAGAARRRRDRPAAVLHRPVTRQGVAGGVRATVRAAGGVRIRDVGVAVRADLAARHPAVRHARLGAAAPDPRRGQRGAGRGRGRQGPRRGGDRRAAAAQPGRHAGLLGDARGDRRGHRRRLAAHRRPGDGQRRRHLHVRVPEEGGAAPTRAEPVSGRGRGGHRRATPTCSRSRSSPCRPSSPRTR